MQVAKLTRHLRLAIFITVSAMSGAFVQAQSQTNDSFLQSATSADGIAAVVNTEVITLRNVQLELETVTKNLKAQQIPIPEPEVLQKQVLQRLIDERLLYQEAAEMGLSPNNVDVDEAAEVVARSNNFSVSQLRTEVEKSGMNWDDYLKGLRQEVLIDQIRQRVIDPTINISDAEIDLFLKTQGINPDSTKEITNTVTGPIEGPIELAQILIRIPEGASSSTRAELKQKAEGLLQQARQGADFAGLAAASSDGPEALQGGSMGARPLEGWPDVFAKAIKDTPTGQLSDVIQSGAGYHILKVLSKGQAQTKPAGSVADNSLIVTQTKARHILIKLDQITTDEKAQDRINQINRRLRNGESFEELARAYSDDSSAPQGGDLGWLHPGETVPAFEQVMDELALGEVSEPVRSQFGWHIIRVEERRDRNVGNEFYRMQARQALHAQRVEPAFDDWFNQVRSQAFIDNRLDPQSSSRRRK